MQSAFIYSRTILNALFVIVSIAFIVWINWQVIGGWFGKNGPVNLGSIEVSYVSMGRFLADFGLPGGSTTWIPFWYLGFPFHIFYTPLLPSLEAFLNKFFTLPLWETYRLITGIAYIVAPISVFLFAWQLSKKVYAGLVAAMVYSVGPTIFYFILKSREVAADRISLDFWDPRRFTVLVRWGEGPHLLSLVFVPLAGVFFCRLLEKSSFLNFSLAGLFLVLAGLTNAIGLLAALMLLAIMAFVHSAQHRSWSGLSLFFGVGVLFFGLISFWYNFTFLSTFFREGGGNGSFIVSLFPWGWVLGLLGVLALYFVIGKWFRNFSILVALLWFVVLFAVVATYYFSAPPDESFARIELLPQALRYNVEVDMALSVFAGVLLAVVVGFLSKRIKVLEWLGYGGAAVIVLFLGLYAQQFIPVAKKTVSQSVDVSVTREKQIADYLENTVNKEIGERVFVPGNYGFYLNWFNNVSQLRGGLYQASINTWPDHIYYQLANGTDPEIALAWLKAVNTGYIVVSAPGSTELYKDIKNQERFETYEKVYEEKGDFIYKVPLKQNSMVKVVSLGNLYWLKPPAKADDKENLTNYINWIEEKSDQVLTIAQGSLGKYQIDGEAAPGEGILVQMSHDSGWSAKDQSGTRLKVTKDPLGFILIEPKSNPFSITLQHSLSWQVWLGYLITCITIVLIIWYGLGRKLLFKHPQ